MKNLDKVFKFELYNTLNKKAFKISTLILSIIIAVGLTVPTIAAAFGSPFFGEDKDISDSKDEKTRYGVIVENDSLDISLVQEQMPNIEILEMTSREDLREKVLKEEIQTGFIVESPIKYEYIVKNTSISDGNKNIFEASLLNIYREKTLSEKGIDYAQVSEVYNTQIQSEMEILGKDGIKNYLHTYILVFGLYFIILFYGQMIATSVASEKSNRSMEILVTSTSTNSLIFGKVFAGALAGILQFAIIMIVAFASYKLNASAWDGNLDFFFDIPGNVLAIFALFGTLGYLLFLFIYGAIGALVSRTEDISTSATPVTFLFIGAFFVSILGLSNPDMLAVKIASFFPFTSFMAMFVRVSMGTVATIQIAISLLILVATTFATGILGARIYRLGTLMYGNPVKITQAFKMLKNK